MITIYHNGECSKSRGALEILQEMGIPHEVRWYLAEPLTKAEISALLEKLNISAGELVRKSEPVFLDISHGKELSESAILEAMVEHPGLIERPIVENGDKAVIARPPERVLELL